MDDVIFSAPDIRQTANWGKYLQSAGWIPEQIGNTLVLVKPFSPLPFAAIKILHPFCPIPFTEIDKIAKKHKAFIVVIEPHSFNYDEESFRKNNYFRSFVRYAHTATIKINLRLTEKELLKSFSENARRNIKKAEKSDLIIETIPLKDEKDNAEFDKFFNLLHNLHCMKKFYIPPCSEFIKKMEAFKKTSTLLFAYEKENPEPIAALWLVQHNNVLSYCHTGITTRGYELSANYLLVWEALKIGQQLNLEVFDFESIYDPRYKDEHTSWKGYTSFKKRFHGHLIEYPSSWMKLYNPFF